MIASLLVVPSMVRRLGLEMLSLSMSTLYPASYDGDECDELVTLKVMTIYSGSGILTPI